MKGFSYTIVHGTLSKPDGTPVVGALVTATPSASLSAGNETAEAQYTARTNAAGGFELRLPANTSDGVFPSNTHYTVACAAISLSVQVVVPVSPAPVNVFALVSSGPAGPEGPEGPEGPAGPVGPSRVLDLGRVEMTDGEATVDSAAVTATNTILLTGEGTVSNAIVAVKEREAGVKFVISSTVTIGNSDFVNWAILA